jgi:hypothetical protein
MHKHHLMTALYAGVLSATLAMSSSAAVINFENGTHDAAVGAFYSAQGVTFSNTRWANIGTTLPGMSGTYAIHNISGVESAPKNDGSQLVVTFATPANTVSIDAIDYGVNGARIDAYDATSGGNLVDFDEAFTANTGTFITLNVAAAQIHRLEIYQPAANDSQDGIVFDDLNFTLNEIPEPSSLGLIALAGALARRRR